jgi:hypothetical protein
MGRRPLYITRTTNPFPLRLPVELLTWLRSEGARRGLPMATLVRVLLIEAQQRAAVSRSMGLRS